MLTVSAMRKILAAAFSCDEDGARPTLDALAHGGLIPIDAVALDAWHVAAVMLACLAWVPPHAVASETMRLASFRSPGMYRSCQRGSSRSRPQRAGYCA